MAIDTAYQILTGFALLVLTVLALACLIRCIIGPRISDRVMSINLIGTLINVVAIIAGTALGVLLRKGIPERMRETVMQGLGLCVLLIGVSGAVKTADTAPAETVHLNIRCSLQYRRSH